MTHSQCTYLQALIKAKRDAFALTCSVEAAQIIKADKFFANWFLYIFIPAGHRTRRLEASCAVFVVYLISHASS